MIPFSPSTKGRLLLAAPPLEDPNFDRTVIYMVEHTDEGAIGVVLNRPLPDLAADELEGLEPWLPLISPPAVLFAGGPVELAALVGVARISGEPSPTWAPITHGVGTVDLGVEPDDVGAEVRALRIFSGYSGWGPGQLEGELNAGAWIVLDALDDDLFGERSEGLWRTVLRRQGGRLAWIANAPDDLSMN